jgi:hypothetical protein
LDKKSDDSRGGRSSSRIRICGASKTVKIPVGRPQHQQIQGKPAQQISGKIGPPLAPTEIRGRIPINDFHKSASEGEGACSRTSAGRSHLPLRGKLGWMTPRVGQKKADKWNASFGGPCSQARAPIFLISSFHFRLPLQAKARASVLPRFNPLTVQRDPCFASLESRLMNLRYRSNGFHSPQHRDSGLSEHVLDFRFL